MERTGPAQNVKVILGKGVGACHSLEVARAQKEGSYPPWSDGKISVKIKKGMVQREGSYRVSWGGGEGTYRSGHSILLLGNKGVEGLFGIISGGCAET